MVTPIDEKFSTLMMGNLTVSPDNAQIVQYVLNTEPKPLTIRSSLTRNNTERVNIFFIYYSFDDAKCARLKLNGTRVPGLPDYIIRICFTKIDDFSVFLLIHGTILNEWEVDTIFNKYQSYLGVTAYPFCRPAVDEYIEKPKTTRFLRFLDVRECRQVIEDLDGRLLDDYRITLRIAGKDLERVTRLIGEEYEREDHIKSKKVVSMDDFNSITMAYSGQFFEEIENSRWSTTVSNDKISMDVIKRQMILEQLNY